MMSRTVHTALATITTFSAAACHHALTLTTSAAYPVVSPESRALVSNHLSSDVHVEPLCRVRQRMT
jgi:hypothetical protein